MGLFDMGEMLFFKREAESSFNMTESGTRRRRKRLPRGLVSSESPRRSASLQGKNSPRIARMRKQRDALAKRFSVGATPRNELKRNSSMPKRPSIRREKIGKARDSKTEPFYCESNMDGKYINRMAIKIKFDSASKSGSSSCAVFVEERINRSQPNRRALFPI